MAPFTRWMIRLVMTLSLCLTVASCSTDDDDDGTEPADAEITDTSPDIGQDTAPDSGVADTGDANVDADVDVPPAEQCASGEDDDGDGDVDCQDTDCQSAPACVVSTIAAGWTHACASFGDGRVRCWGDGSSGALGDDTMETGAKPPVVVSDIDDATDVAVGRDFSCALREDQTVSCWGSNEFGQLGDATYIGSPVPVSVAGLQDATAITAGEHSACAVRDSGQVVCWGLNDRGQLGDGSNDNRNEPVDVQLFALVEIISLDDTVDVDCHGKSCCALRSDGKAACWGHNNSGQLAAGSDQDDSNVALTVVEQTNPIRALTNISDLGTAYVFSCFAREDESLWCAGDTTRRADGVDGLPRIAIEMEFLGDISEVWGGLAHACALRSSGRVVCWGANSFGQTGEPDTTLSGAYQLPGVQNPRDLSAGHEFTCFADAEGKAFCFGDNSSRQLGVEIDEGEDALAEPQRVIF